MRSKSTENRTKDNWRELGEVRRMFIRQFIRMFIAKNYLTGIV